MTDLRTAAQQALEAMSSFESGTNGLYEGEFAQEIAALRAALADDDNLSPGEPVQDVKGCDHCENPMYAAIKCRVCGRVTEPVQEPYAWMSVGGSIWRHKTTEDDVPLYTAPRKPLAEWQINDLMSDIDPEDRDSWSFRQGVYAAEKHHGVRR